MKYLVWPADEDESTADTVEAVDAQDAAKKWAEMDESRSGEYSILNGYGAVVFVTLFDSAAPVLKFDISGEEVPTYSAQQLEAGG